MSLATAFKVACGIMLVTCVVSSMVKDRLPLGSARGWAVGTEIASWIGTVLLAIAAIVAERQP